MEQYGWVVSVERCAYLDLASGEKVFNVNLARPWARDHELQDVRGPQLADANIQLGDLLFPWDWANLAWSFFGRDGAGTWHKIQAAPLPGGSQLLDSKDVTDLRKAVRAEVEETAASCERPFSQGMEDFWTRKWRSHVHALAPLTHWPALVSEQVLRLSFFVAIAPAELGAMNEVAAFPEFDIVPTPLVKSAQIRLKAGVPLAPPKHPLTNGAKVEVAAEYQDAMVGFISLAAGTADAAPKTGSPVLSQGLATRSAARDAVQDYLLPAQLLRLWLQKHKLQPAKDKDEDVDDADLRQALTRSLWQALGVGREPRTGEENVLELFLAPQQGAERAKLRDTLKGFIMSDGAAAKALIAAADVLMKERQAVAPASWTAEDSKRWALRFCDFEQVAGAKPGGATFSLAWASAAEMVLGRETGLELYGPWLANALDTTLAPKLGAEWAAIKARLLAPGGVRVDLIARARGSGISTAQWDAANAIVGKLDPTLVKQFTISELEPLVQATLKNVEAALDSAVAYAGIAPTLEPVVAEAVAAWGMHMQETVKRARRRPRDRGIRLDFTQLADPGGKDVQRLRGFAISLCGAIATEDDAWTPDIDRAAWATDAALRYTRVKGKPAEWLNRVVANPKDDDTAWSHETVGATYNDGELVLSVEYEGAPLAVSATDEDDAIGYEPGDDGFGAVDLAWRRSSRRELPLLGFGMLYKGAATAIDNAGGVVDKDFRANPAELASAGSLAVYTDATGALQYRSSEPPGAPVANTLPDTKFYELSDETQAHAYQHRQRAAKPGKVVLLAHDRTLCPTAESSCSIVFKPPKASFTFIERWLNTDRVLIERGQGKHVSDERLMAFDSKAIKGFIERFRERSVKGAPVPVPHYHPAVEAIGIEIEAPGVQRALVREFKRLDAKALEPAAYEFKLEVKTAASGQVGLRLSDDTATVTVPQGRFVRVRLFSLVSAKNFAADKLASSRFVDGIQLDPVKGFEGWHAFGPAEHWFETVPEWRENDYKGTDPALSMAGPRVETSPTDGRTLLVSPNLVTAELDFRAAPWVKWVKGVHAQRHDWHWTGYPVDFPEAGAGIAEWLPSLAGVESFREIADVTLPTSFAHGDQWTIGSDAANKQMFYRHELTVGRRPARYVAVFARPMLRFRRWLDPKLGLRGPASLEARIWGAGLLVAGRAEPGSHARLPVPVLHQAIPLTATYASTQPFSREANGVLLVFGEAIRRTDDLARLGGVGDTLEVDLVETRVAAVPEIGNNPIFHGAKDRLTAGKPLQLVAKPPFGLTFDIGTNAKVAQTAVIVQPVHAGGNWVLAKARVRRAVLPETELGAGVDPGAAPPAADAAMRRWYPLANRIEGDESVPLDVAVDVAVKATPQLRIRVGKDDKVIAVPPSGGPGTRYVISWHKGRWGTGSALPTWRCQVHAQRREPGSMNWFTFAKKTGHDNAGSELPHGWRDAGSVLGIDLSTAEAKVAKIRLSDYTDPVWLTFIGSFGQEQLATPDSFVFAARADGSLELRAVGDATPLAPALVGLDDSLAGSDPRWHLVLVFRAAKDVTRGRAGDEGGVLVAVYWKRGGKLVRLPQSSGESAPDLRDCRAHVLALQRITALSEVEKKALDKASTLPEVLDTIFPGQAAQPRESLARFLPEYLGPISIES